MTRLLAWVCGDEWRRGKIEEKLGGNCAESAGNGDFLAWYHVEAKSLET